MERRKRGNESMKQNASDKYSVAWFKLADCIARGEKERALGVYRLLSHSLDDSALAQQLYGDILLSFNDISAAQGRYIQAAEKYEQEGRLVQAAAIYEHLTTLQSDNIAYKEKLIELYQRLNIASKVREYATELIAYLLSNNNWQKSIEIARNYDTAGDGAFAALMHEQLVFTLLTINDVLPETVMGEIKKVIDAWSSENNEDALDEFMQKLKVADELLYEKAEKYKQ